MKGTRGFISIAPSLSRRQVVGGMLAAAVTLPAFSLVAKVQAAESVKGDAASSSVKDGTYTSSKNGMNDMLNVTVTFKDGKITDVQLDEDEETDGIGGALKNKNGDMVTTLGAAPVTLLPQLIVDNNSIAVDSVTGATITSATLIAAVQDCIEQAGGSADDFQNPVTYPAYEDGQADIVIVGGGGAGLVAAIASAQQGKKVAIIEKNGECGGDTLVCGGIYNCPDEALQSKVEMSDSVKSTIEKALAATSDDPDKQAQLEELQAVVQKQWDEYKASGRTDLFDSKEWYALQTWLGGDMVADLDLVKTLADNAYDGLTWLEDLGAEFQPDITQGPGSLWQRTHASTMPLGQGLISTYGDALADYADMITLYNEATATALVTEDGAVTGVTVTDNHNGSSFTINATDGVIMCTGGFSANAEMVQEYNTSGKWSDLSSVPTTNRFTCSQGDGITMTQDALDPSLTDMDQIQLLFLGNVVNGQITKYPPRCVTGLDQVIFVNKEGQRFVQEDGRRDQICLAVLDQTDKMFYIIESADGDDYVDIDSDQWRSADGFTFTYLEDNGYVFRGDDLAELAGKIDIDADTLQATVDSFNQAVETGSDELGRTLFSTKLEHGPWIAYPRQACIHHTMGGLTIDTEAHALDENGDAIAGLHAAGEVTGGIHGGNRLGGNAVVDTVVFGKLAADSLIAEA